MFRKRKDKKSGGNEGNENDMGFEFSNSQYNEKAVEVVWQYDITEWQNDLDDTTEARLRTELENFIKTSGYTIGDVIKGLVDAGLDEEIAEIIAQTEITRVFALAEERQEHKIDEENDDDWDDIRKIKTWFTCNDDMVCEVCRALHNRTVLVDDDFTEGIASPPAHPGCRCWISTSPDITESVELYKDTKKD